MSSWFPTFEWLLGRRIEPPPVWPPFTTRSQSRTLARLLAVAIEENLPLVPLLEPFAHDERGRQKRRLRRLIELLRSGRNLPDAVEDVRGILRDEQVLALRFDAQSGTRAAALRRQLDAASARADQPRQRAGRTLVYLLIMLAIGLLIFLFLNVKIVPVFLKMMQEFELAPAPALRGSADITNWVLRYWWLVGLALLGALWLIYSTAAGRLMRHSLVVRLMRPLGEREAASVVDALAVAAGAGRPLAGALSTLARYHYAPDVRNKLLYVRNEVEQGAGVWASMSDVGMLSAADGRALATAERLGNRPWVLEKLAETKRRRSERWLDQAAELVLPAVVIVLGILVVLVALIVFQPLIQLIEALS
jgi:type II secretory pathway component PulF